MAFQIVEDPLDIARDEAIETLGATRTTTVNTDRFEWLYQNNPDGQAVLWSVRKVETGEMAGFTVALPRRMLVDGQPKSCWNGADFSMKPKFRTLGLALKLRRAAKEGVDAGRVDFLYAHPNDRMAVIHEKVGHQPVGAMVRWAKPLKTAPYVQAKVRSRTVGAMMGTLLDPALRLVGKETWRRADGEFRHVFPSRFDDRYDRLFEEAAGVARVLGVRDARYLNWRYAENPLYETHAVELCDGRNLRGYATFTVADEVANVKDIFAPDATVSRDLIAGVIRRARKLRLKSLSFALLEGNLLEPCLVEFGFRKRVGQSRMFAYTTAESSCREAVLDAESWFATVGDRDV